MFRQFKHILFSRFQIKLILYVLLIVLIPLITLGVITMRVSSTIIEDELMQSYAQTMNQAVDNLEYYLENMEMATLDVALDPALFISVKSVNRTYDYNDVKAISEIQSRLNKQLSVQTGLKSIFLIGEDDYFISRSSSNRAIPPFQENLQESIKKVEWYHEAVSRRGKSVYTIVNQKDDLIINPDDVGAVRLIRQLKNTQNGVPIGVLGVDLDVKLLDEIMLKLQTKHRGVIFIVDDEGKLIYWQDPEDWLARSNYIQYAESTEQNGMDRIRIEKEDLLRIYRTSSVSGWKIMQLIPYSDIFSPIAFIKKTTIVLVVMGLIASLVMSVFFSRRLVKPLRMLVDLTKKVQQGDLDVRFEHRRLDEVGILAMHFNRMINRLNEMQKAIYQEQELKRKAELSALQAQIQPHFLYNTLDSVKWMAVIRGENQISEMITALVNLLRKNISLGNEIIPIAQEVENLQNYVHIQRMRYLNNFEVEFHVDDKALSCGIPKLILQPYVENALYHGIDASTKGGKIELHIRCEDEHVLCHIRDNGKGMDQKTLQAALAGELKSNFSGISLKNVEERLKLHFGQQYGVVFETAPGTGTTVQIKIPAVSVNKEDGIHA